MERVTSIIIIVLVLGVLITLLVSLVWKTNRSEPLDRTSFDRPGLLSDQRSRSRGLGSKAQSFFICSSIEMSYTPEFAARGVPSPPLWDLPPREGYQYEYLYS